MFSKNSSTTSTKGFQMSNSSVFIETSFFITKIIIFISLIRESKFFSFSLRQPNHFFIKFFVEATSFLYFIITFFSSAKFNTDSSFNSKNSDEFTVILFFSSFSMSKLLIPVKFLVVSDFCLLNASISA